MSKAFVRIVFLQGEDYAEFEKELDRNYDAGLAYLTQWDYGDDDDIHAESCAGKYDDFYYSEMGDFTYLMTWNRALGYASLQRIIYSDDSDDRWDSFQYPVT